MKSELSQWAERLRVNNPNVELWQLVKKNKTTGIYMTKEKIEDRIISSYTSPIFHVWAKDKCICSLNDYRSAYETYLAHIEK